MPAFDVEGRWRLGEQVALRPEPFGALAYHFGTRRLSFLKSPVLVRLVEALEHHPSAQEAAVAAGVASEDMPVYAAALERLRATGMIEPRVAA
jgi:putative mycofactocin binding protein MftB